MTAMDLTSAPMGSTSPAFLSSTIPCSAISRAVLNVRLRRDGADLHGTIDQAEPDHRPQDAPDHLVERGGIDLAAGHGSLQARTPESRRWLLLVEARVRRGNGVRWPRSRS